MTVTTAGGGGLDRIRVWDIHTYELRHVLRGHEAAINALVLSVRALSRAPMRQRIVASC